ncbi:MAG: TonB-dependent receptor [Acidobacteria bacterium]|nr:MAG: TonB-dependent receptor [Acidobacteriota bacterium]
MPSRLLFAAITLSVLLSVQFPSLLRAQGTTGAVAGLVSLAGGAPVPGAQVVVTNPETGLSRSRLTDDSGSYLIEFLPAGQYRLEVAFAGFKHFVREGVVVEVNRSNRLDPILEPGDVGESIHVIGEAPLVQTTSGGATGQTINSVDIDNLPLVNRDVYRLLELTPGVDSQSSNSSSATQKDTAVSGSANAGGGTVNYLLDGGSNVIGLRNQGGQTPSPDAIQEFQVSTNGLSAEYGRFAGGVISVVTKSGTNDFHGSLYEFVRNDKLNANRWTPGETAFKEPLRRNVFGGTFGGPIVRSKAFFFFSFDGLRERGVEYVRSATPPTALERMGDFSASPRKPLDPLTGAPFPDARIPAVRFDSVARKILETYLPLPNLPNGRLEGQAPKPTDTDTFQGKITYAPRLNHQLDASLMYSTLANLDPFDGNIPGWVSRKLDSGQLNVSIGDTWTLNDTTVNVLRASYLRSDQRRVNLPELSARDLGSEVEIQGPRTLPRILVNGRFDMSVATAGPFAGGNNYHLRELLSLTRGRHSIKTGGEAQLEKIIDDTTLDNYGRFDFNRTRTGGSGDSLGDFLLGLPIRVKQDSPVTKIDNSWFFAGFIQDDIRIHSRLTLNLGVRYDLQLPYRDPLDRKVTFVEGRRSEIVPGAPPGLLFPGDAGVGRAIVEADKDDVMPRLGLAWDPLGHGKTVARCGAGIFFGTTSATMWNITADNQPFTARQWFNNPGSLSKPYANQPDGKGPFPYFYSKKSPRFLYPTNLSGPSLDFRVPYVYQLNLSLEHQLMSDLRISAAYVGSLGHHWYLDEQLNRPVWNPSATSSNRDLRRPVLPGVFGDITLLNSVLNTNYHALQITTEKRFSHDFQFKGYYTWSKSIDDADSQGGGRSTVQDPWHIRADRGRSSSDRRHVFSLAAVWLLHYGKRLPRPVRSLVQDWRLSAIAKAGGGRGFTVSNGEDRNYDGWIERANLIGNPRLDPNRPRGEVVRQWFDTDAFALTSQGTGEYGNSGRNIIDGPGFKKVDLSLFRDFAAGEKVRLQVRFEANNFFNLVNLQNPETAMNDRTNFGRILTAAPMREVQLGLRLTF